MIQWLVRYGTVSFLVDAISEAEAERKVRFNELGKGRLRPFQVKNRFPVRHGPIFVRPATDEDREVFRTRGAMV